MAITFLQQRQKQKYLILVLVATILLMLFFLWRGFLAKPGLAPPVISKPPEIKINFQVLKNPSLKELQLFEEIKPLEEQIGRENPFIPY